MNAQTTTKLRSHGHIVVPPWAFRWYALICEMADKGEPVTFKRMAARMERSKAASQHIVELLSRAGLISYQRSAVGTIRPLYRVRLFKEDGNGC